MNFTSTLKIAAGTALLFSATAIFAKDVRPQDALIKVSASQLTIPHANPGKSQGLPTADGDKPGNGNGYGHEKGVGRGHEIGRGHGHDGDPKSP